MKNELIKLSEESTECYKQFLISYDKKDYERINDLMFYQEVIKSKIEQLISKLHIWEQI